MERKYEKWDFLTGSFSSFEIFEMVGFGGKRLSFLTSHFLAIKRGFVIKFLLISKHEAFRKQIQNNLCCRPGSCRAVGFLPRRFLDAHQKNHETPIHGKRYETPETARIRNEGGPCKYAPVSHPSKGAVPGQLGQVVTVGLPRNSDGRLGSLNRGLCKGFESVRTWPRAVCICGLVCFASQRFCSVPWGRRRVVKDYWGKWHRARGVVVLVSGESIC